MVGSVWCNVLNSTSHTTFAQKAHDAHGQQSSRRSVRQEASFDHGNYLSFDVSFLNLHLTVQIPRKKLRRIRFGNPPKYIHNPVSTLMFSCNGDSAGYHQTRKARNKTMHITHGNTVILQLEPLLFPEPEFTREVLLQHRLATPLTNSDNNIGIYTTKNPVPRRGHRVTRWSALGYKSFFKPPKVKDTFNQKGSFQNSLELDPVQPPPPPNGAPGTPKRSDEECEKQEGQPFSRVFSFQSNKTPSLSSLETRGQDPFRRQCGQLALSSPPALESRTQEVPQYHKSSLVFGNTSYQHFNMQGVEVFTTLNMAPPKSCHMPVLSRLEPSTFKDPTLSSSTI